MIPSIVHILWPNTNLTFSDRQYEQNIFQNNVRKIELLNPTWDVNIWTDEKFDMFISQKWKKYKNLLFSLKPKLKKLDAVRPLILYTYGGLYVDIDVECFKSFYMLKNYEFVCQKKKLSVTGNHFMGSIPENPIWIKMIEYIQKNKNKHMSVIDHTGNGALAWAFDQTLALENNYSMRLLEEPFFVNGAKKHVSSKTICQHKHALSPIELKKEDDNFMGQLLDSNRLNKHN